jgi:hypothetical protein
MTSTQVGGQDESDIEAKKQTDAIRDQLRKDAGAWAAARVDKHPAARPAVTAVKNPRRVFGTLTMPNGQQIRTMREDAFLAALAAKRTTAS